MARRTRKGLNLTDTTCGILEDVRLAIEVLLGTHIRFRRFSFEKDLRSGEAQFFHDGDIVDLKFLQVRRTLYDVTIGHKCYTARYDNRQGGWGSETGNPHEVRIVRTEWKRGPEFKWTVGTSPNNRWEEPVY